MIIRKISDNEDELYYDLAKKWGTVFNSKEWHANYSNKIERLGLFSDKGLLIGGFNLQIVILKGMIKYCRVPYMTPNISLFYSKDLITNENSFQKEISEAIIVFLEKSKFHLTIFSFPVNFLFLQSFYWKKFKVIPRFTYRLNLIDSLDVIYSKLSKGKKRDLKKAKKDGLVVKLSQDYETVRLLVNKTFQRKNKTYQSELVDKILFNFANESNSFAFITYENNIPISTTFCIFDNTTVYYLLGGYDSLKKHSGAGVLSLWNSIEYAKSINKKVFDFEGSMIPEIEKYFRDFGGCLVPYFSINKGLLPIELFLKFFKRQLF